MITGDVSGETLVRQVQRAVAAGVDFVQLRRRGLPARDLESLARRLLDVARGTGSRILVNGRLDVALAVGASGVHLPADGLPTSRVRKAAPPDFVVSRSTHVPGEVERAFREGASFVVFGPIFPTPSKPGHPGVGLDALREAVAAAPVPVYALGGVTPERVEQIACAGAHGVAGISVFEREEKLVALLDRIRRTSS
jgi:thiamine-phosphate pyrophosphorylase